MTPAETKLWAFLRDHQIERLNFRRQVSVGPFVLDFYCPARHLAVEVDGSIHDLPEVQAADAERQRYVEALGIRFLRFSNAQVHNDIQTVIASITKAVREKNAPITTPEVSQTS